MLLVAAIEFVAPLFLLGTLAAGIPLLIHLLQRQRAPEMPFSTLRFLEKSVNHTARRRRLNDLLLLVLRMLVVALLAIGLAGPLVVGAGSFLRGSTTSAVIVLDDSLSMAVVDGGQSRFERARDAVHELLDRLEQGDRVALLRTGGPNRRQDALYADVDNAARMLEEMTVTPTGADLMASIEEARALLDQAETGGRELYVVTDMQRSGWEGLLGASAGTATETSLADLVPGEPLGAVILDVHESQPDDVALAGLTLRGTTPAVGLPVQVVVEVQNLGARGRDVQVELLLDGQVIDRPAPSRVAGGERRTMTFTATPTAAGVHEGEVRLVGNDASSANDRLSFVLDTQAVARVALVEYAAGDDARGRFRRAGYYLERALRPFPGDAYAIDVTNLTPELLASEPLDGYAAIFCVDVTSLADEAVDSLERYVFGGGSLMWVCGPDTDPAALTVLAGERDLLAGRFSHPEAGQLEGRHWAYLDEGDPVLTPLATPASLYTAVTVDRYVVQSLEETTPVRVLARLDNGDPALTAHPVGRGSVWVLLTGAHASWTTLPVRPIFVPLVNRFVLLARGSGLAGLSNPVVAGTPATFPFPGEPSPVTVEVRQPGLAEPTRVTTEAIDGRQTLRWPDTYRLGVYDVTMLEASQPRRFAFAVGPDPREAGPETAAVEAVTERLAERDIVAQVVPAGSGLGTRLDALADDSGLMDLFLICVLLGGLIEVFIANRTSDPAAESGPPAPGAARRAALRRATEVHGLGGQKRLTANPFG